MAKAAASSPLEDLDLSGEEVQRLTSAFQDPEFRRMFSQYTEELADPENRRRYEAEITALERERGVEVRFVHPEPGYVLRTSLDGTRRCFVNVCGNTLERLFVNEENVNEFLEDILSSPLQQTAPLTPPLIEVLQVTDSKIQIQAKLQKCNSEQLQEEEERANEGSHVTEKEKIEHPTTSTTDSDSSIAVKVLEIDSCGSAEYLQQESLDVSQVLFGKSQQPESKMEPEFIKEKSAVYSNEGKDNLKEPVMTEEKELTVHNIPGFDNIKETNMQDGSVQIIKDHVTHCAFSFQNSLLYDLD
ncbi:protein kintoun isoform 5-T5 [Glossophaga mutica]